MQVNGFGQDNFFTDADSFFKKYVKDGKVAYSTLKNNQSQLTPLISYIGNATPEDWATNQKKAFYINAYNLLVISSVVELYPIKSPLDSKGFFDEKKHKVAEESLTLNQIENEKLRQEYEDARIHFVLVCAAVGCPKLMSYAYKPSNIEDLLEKRTKETLNDPYFIRISKKNGKLLVSEIFKWYKGDFLKTHNTVKEYVERYLISSSDLSSYKLGYYAYDWTINAL